MGGIDAAGPMATVELQADIASPSPERWSACALVALQRAAGLRAVVASLGATGTAFFDGLDGATT